MASYNKVILMGNLTRDPDTRVTPGGLTICKFTIATNRVFNGQDGERREEVTYIDCDSFGKPAETIARYMGKGRAIMVEGRLKLDQWEDRNSGEKRSKLGVVVETFQFVGSKSDNEGTSRNYDEVSPPQRAAKPASAPTSTPAKASEPASSEDFDDDVPF